VSATRLKKVVSDGALTPLGRAIKNLGNTRQNLLLVSKECDDLKQQLANEKRNCAILLENSQKSVKRFFRMRDAAWLALSDAGKGDFEKAEQELWEAENVQE
jgi:hypothetical protein